MGKKIVNHPSQVNIHRLPSSFTLSLSPFMIQPYRRCQSMTLKKPFLLLLIFWLNPTPFLCRSVVTNKDNSISMQPSLPKSNIKGPIGDLKDQMRPLVPIMTSIYPFVPNFPIGNLKDPSVTTRAHLAHAYPKGLLGPLRSAYTHN